MLCSITSKFTIRQAASRVLSEFFDGDYPTKHFKFGEISECFRLVSQAGIQISTAQTVSERRAARWRDFRQANGCHT